MNKNTLVYKFCFINTQADCCKLYKICQFSDIAYCTSHARCHTKTCTQLSKFEVTDSKETFILNLYFTYCLRSLFHDQQIIVPYPTHYLLQCTTVQYSIR